MEGATVKDRIKTIESSAPSITLGSPYYLFVLLLMAPEIRLNRQLYALFRRINLLLKRVPASLFKNAHVRVVILRAEPVRDL